MKDGELNRGRLQMFSVFRRKGKQQTVEAPQEVKSQEPSLESTLAASTFVQTYPVFEPYVQIAIVQEPDGKITYRAIEPLLSKKEKEVLEQTKEVLRLALEIDARTVNPKTAEEYLRNETIRILKRFEIKIRKETFEKIMYYVVRDFLRYDRIDPLMRDSRIEDISCDGPKVPIYVWHREFESIPTNIVFEEVEKLDKFVMRAAYMSGRHMSVAQPLVDAALPDGSRIQLTYGAEVTKKGSTFTIRKFKEDPLSIVDLLNYGTLNSEVAALLWLALESKSSILLAGGTASGKTTTINVLSMFIRPENKIVTIEDTPEINLAHTNWIQSIARAGIGGIGEVTLYDLLRAALRQRPDFIIVGEVRGAEASTLFQAISTGHAGLSSIHADSVPAVFHRLVSEPMNIPRTLIPAVNFILYQSRVTVREKPTRRILSTTEVLGIDARTNEFITNEIYRYNQDADTFTYSGRCYIMERIAKTKGMTQEELRRDLDGRKMIFDWMVKNNIRKYKKVADIIGNYYQDPESLLAQVRVESITA